MFPGQGVQHVGMCAAANETPEIRRMFESASEIVGYDLLKTCSEGPEAILHSTATSQPAIFVASMAATYILEQKLLVQQELPLLESVHAACGLSLGEYSALASAQAFNFEDGVKLVHARGKAMEMALAASPSSTMVNITGLEEEIVAQLCEAACEQSGEPVAIANFLHQKNYTVSGGCTACEALCDLAEQQHADTAKVSTLAVGGAFHSVYVKSAEDLLREALDSVTLRPPIVPVLSNVDTTTHTSPEQMKELLVRQLVAPVRWETTVRKLLRMHEENDSGEGPRVPLVWYELGPGRGLSAILKRIHRRAKAVQLSV
jgi:[acyl-carrier-protein] S-malonyltransferase